MSLDQAPPQQDTQWQPPVPSLASLPVDKTKTDPKPAYYKLQFGDEVTGFSYYVRTLRVIIGRNTERQVPPDEREQGVPTHPPLGEDGMGELDGQMGMDGMEQSGEDVKPALGMEGMEGIGAMGGLDMESLFNIDMPPSEFDPSSFASVDPPAQGSKEPPTTIPRARTTPPMTNGHLEAATQPPQALSAPPEPHIKLEPDFEAAFAEPESYFDPRFAPPPPPDKKNVSVDHVDVDLGPLKSVSRNHAKIEYHNELGHFCLEITGRNGAWVDDRYFVKGSTVPLAQMSQIQIATRIFHFILPPSAANSPYSSYGCEDTNIALEDVPYPYNLPPTEVGYAEFYGEPGPGPASAAAMASRFPTDPAAYNPFAGPDGLGMGIEGVEGRVWDDEWDNSDGELSPFDEEELLKYGAMPAFGIPPGMSFEGMLLPDFAMPDVIMDVPMGAPVPELPPEATIEPLETPAPAEPPTPAGSTADPAAEAKPKPKPKKKKKDETKKDETKDGDGEAKPPPKKKAPAKKDTKKKKAAAPVEIKPHPLPEAAELSMPTADEVATLAAVLAAEPIAPPPPPSPPLKPADPAPAPTPKAPTKPPPKTAPPKPAPPKAQAKAPEANVEVKTEAGPAKPAEKPTAQTTPAKAAPPVKPPIPNKATPTKPLPPAAAQAKPPQPANANAKPVPKPVPGAAAGPATPGASGAPGAAGPAGPRPQGPGPPKPLPKAAVAASAAASATSSPAPPTPTRKDSTPAPSEPPKPFYLTELIETPGRPGHIVVNVPIPPSGAGPRPPPGPLIGLDGEAFIGPPPLKPTATFATIIHRALLYLPRGRGTLGEVCNWVAGEWEWFRLNIDAGWQNSIRHNLSLNKAFLKVPRIPEDDPESKGSVWIIDPEEGPLFEEKQRKDALKSAGKEKNAEQRREKERQKVEERMRKQRDAYDNGHVYTSPAPNAKPVLPRPNAIPARPAQRASPAVSANAKGLLQPKAKITVSIQVLTAAHRAKSVIATTDASGNPLPFACDGTTLMLDQGTFGHLTQDIIDKLTLLGAAGAVDVLSAWVINKNKNQAARAAQQAAQAQANAKPTAASMKANLTRPATGAAPGTTTAPGTASTSTAPAASATSSATPATAAGSNAKPAPKPVPKPTGKLPGPAPPGATLTKVIGMIAEVANAKGDVNTVGPNAGALLRYIRVVGVDIDLRVAERIWATGVVPPLPKKGAVGAKPAGAGGANGAGGAAGTAGAKPLAAPGKPATAATGPGGAVQAGQAKPGAGVGTGAGVGGVAKPGVPGTGPKPAGPVGANLNTTGPPRPAGTATPGGPAGAGVARPAGPPTPAKPPAPAGTAAAPRPANLSSAPTPASSTTLKTSPAASSASLAPPLASRPTGTGAVSPAKAGPSPQARPPQPLASPAPAATAATAAAPTLAAASKPTMNGVAPAISTAPTVPTQTVPKPAGVPSAAPPVASGVTHTPAPAQTLASAAHAAPMKRKLEEEGTAGGEEAKKARIDGAA